MQFLEKSTKSFQVALLAAPATLPLVWEASWEIHEPGAPAGPTDRPQSNGGSLTVANGTTAVTVVPGPLAGGQQNRLRNFQIANGDSATATVLWQKFISDTNVTRTLMSVTLLANETLVYDENGWTTYDSQGSIKSTNTTAANTAQSVAVSGGIVASTAQSTATSNGAANSEAVSAGLATSVATSGATSAGLSASVSASGGTSAGLAASSTTSAATSGGLAVSQATSAGLADSVTRSEASSTGLVASKATSAITSGNV
jgi:hypothetical protein